MAQIVDQGIFARYLQAVFVNGTVMVVFALFPCLLVLVMLATSVCYGSGAQLRQDEYRRMEEFGFAKS